MARELLIDIIPFQVTPEVLKESQVKNDGKVILKGVIQRAGAKNKNGRVYPRNVLEKAVGLYTKEFINENRAVGELDHPDSDIVSLERGSHRIRKLWWEGQDLMADLEVLCDTPTEKGTPMGNILLSYIQKGITVGISSRGLGSVNQVAENNILEVQDDLEFIAWDMVSNPSTHKAYMTKMNEGKQSSINEKNNEINEIIDDILSSIPKKK